MTELGTRYRAYWGNEEDVPKNLTDPAYTAAQQERKAQYAEIARDHYTLTTANYEASWGPRFHFCPFPDAGEPIEAALSRHEHFLWLMMGLKPGMRGLDAGCGTGGPSRNLVRFVDVHVTGVNITPVHLERARWWAGREGVGGRVEYVEGDFMNLPFEDDTFDFVYAMEATVYAPDLRACYTELTRVLKPGGAIGIYECAMTSLFCPTDPTHLDIRRRIERGAAMTELQTTEHCLAAFRGAGLDVEWSEDRALVGNDPKKRWWYCVAGDVAKTSSLSDLFLVFRLKQGFWRVCLYGMWVSEKVKLERKGVVEALKTQWLAVSGYRDGGMTGIYTPCWMMVGRKPEGWVKPTPSPAVSA